VRRMLIAGLLLASACSPAEATTTTSSVAETPETATSAPVATTQPVVAVEARFALGTVVFGEQGRIEVVNTGPQPGNVHGYWIAIHPFYLELPSAIVEVGDRVTVGFDETVTPDALVQAKGLLPVLSATGGEIGLYANGTFGDPTAIVDYVEWGQPGHFRSTVAMAAGIWAEDRIVTTTGNEGGLVPAAGAPPQLLDADLVPLPDAG
jgi:hypothetical protein